MSFWIQTKQTFSEIKGMFKKHADQLKHASTVDAVLACCALVASADGSVTSPERSKVAKFLASSPYFKSFDAKELKEKFEKYCQEMADDRDFGEINLLAVVRKVQGKDAAETVLQLAHLIASADGDFAPSEKLVVEKIAKALNLNVPSL